MYTSMHTKKHDLMYSFKWIIFNEISLKRRSSHLEIYGKKYKITLEKSADILIGLNSSQDVPQDFILVRSMLQHRRRKLR